jgi:predicted cobalt transporter CbtA
VIVLPAIVYPPLPPGVASQLPIRERQQLYLAVVGIGLASFGAAVRLWSSGHRFRIPLAVAAVAIPAVLAALLFPDNGADESVLPPGLLAHFRVVSIAAQLLFWSTLGLTGALLLRGRERRRAEAAAHSPDAGEETTTA